MNRIALIVLSIVIVSGITILILWLTGVLFKKKTQEDHSKDFISGSNNSGFMLDPRIENYIANTEETEEDVNIELEGIITNLKNSVAYKDLEKRAISIANTTKDEILASILTVSSNQRLIINLFRDTGYDDINQYKNRKKIICQNEDVTKNTLELITNSIPGNILFSKLVDMMRPMVFVNDDKTEEPFYIAEVTCTSKRDNKTNLCLEEEPENISITLRDFIENNVPMFGVEFSDGIGSYKIRQSAGPNEPEIARIKFEDQTQITIVSKTLYGEGSRDSHVRKLYENNNNDNTRMELKYNEVSMSAKQFNQLIKTYNIEIVSKGIEESFKDCGA
tara:strand:- start:3485 stop:4486 length:1002 start_codon:yes stop_codon:yes gene_type:complete